MNQQHLLAKLQTEGIDISQSTLSKNVSILWLMSESKN